MSTFVPKRSWISAHSGTKQVLADAGVCSGVGSIYSGYECKVPRDGRVTI